MRNELNTLIMEAMKAHDTVRTETLRGIKTAFMNWQTSKEHAGKEMTDADEINILKKMIKQREESIDQYRSAGRNDLANAEADQVAVIKEFMPAEVTAEQIEFVVENIVLSRVIEPIKKNMGAIVKAVKETLPTADGKLVAQIVQKHLV